MANLLEQGLRQSGLAYSALQESATNSSRKFVADIKSSQQKEGAAGGLAGAVAATAAESLAPKMIKTASGQHLIGNFDSLIGSLAGKVFPGLLRNRRAPSLSARPPSAEAPVGPGTTDGNVDG